MTDQRVVKWGQLTFSDGTTVNPPPIGGSQNGWVYKPDELRTKQDISSGKNRAWPRGSGWGVANEYLQEYLTRQITSRNWEIPSAVEKQIEDPTGQGQGDALSVSWWVEPWGWTTLGIQRPTDSYGRRKAIPGNDDKLTYTLTMHELGMMYMEKEIGNVHGSFPRADTVTLRATTDLKVEDMKGAVLAWIANPVKEALKRIALDNASTNLLQRFNEVLGPPDLTKLTYGPGDQLSQVPDDLVVTQSQGMLRLHQQGEIRRVLEDDVAWDELNGILDAFRYLGFDLRVDTGYVYGEPNQVKAIIIEVHPNKDESSHNELGHTVTLDAQTGTINVECGYARDETLWIDRQSRIAAKQMDQLEEDLWTESTITLERKEE